MDRDLKARFTNRFESVSRNRRRRIQEQLRFSAVTSKASLLHPSIRSYGSPRIRRKREVEQDTEFALSFMSPYPNTACDILDDVDALHGVARIPKEAVSGATARRSNFAAPLLRSHLREQTTSNALDASPQTVWGVNARQFQKPRPQIIEEKTQYEEKREEIDSQQESIKEALKKLEPHGDETYSRLTKSLILRTNKKLYDAPSGLYMDMTKRALGLKPEDGKEVNEASRTRKMTSETSNLRSDPTFLRRMAEATAAAVAAEAAHANGSTTTNRATKDKSHESQGGGGGAYPTKNRKQKILVHSKPNEESVDESLLGLSLGDLNSSRDVQQKSQYIFGHHVGLHRIEEEVDNWEEDNATYVHLLLEGIPKWNKGPPSVFASGANISSRAHAWRDEARVQGEDSSRVLETYESERAVTASMYRSRVGAENEDGAIHSRNIAYKKNDERTKITPIVLGKTQADLASPGIIHVHKRRTLVMGAAPWNSYQDKDNLTVSHSGMRASLPQPNSSSDEQKSEWEMKSKANAIVFHEAVSEPSKLRDTSRRFDFTHHQNNRRVGISRLKATGKHLYWKDTSGSKSAN